MLKKDLIRFVKVTNDDLMNFIVSAKERIIFAKPAFTKQEVEEIVRAVRTKKLSCKLYMEKGDKAIRFGFGESQALELINANLDKLSIQLVNRIRMAIIIVDHEILIYVPDISFIDEQCDSLAFPNGLFGNQDITENIIREFIEKEKSTSLQSPKSIIPFPGCNIPETDENISKTEIEKSIESLKESPAVDPSKLRKVSFYRNNYKLLKITVMGVKIENKKISLSPFLSLLSTNNEKNIRSWGIFDKEDIKKLQDTLDFQCELENIKQKYLLDAGRFGYIIDVKTKNNFKDEIEKLKKEFKEYFQGEALDVSKNRFLKKKMARQNEKNTNKGTMETLHDILLQSREELVDELLKISKGDTNFIDTIRTKDRQLDYRLRNGLAEAEQISKEFIERFIINNLKFPDEEDIFKSIDVKVDYVDISDELLNDNEDFAKVLEKYKNNENNNGLVIREYDEGFEESK